MTKEFYTVEEIAELYAFAQGLCAIASRDATESCRHRW